jgi:hypothetical protein
MDKFCPPSLEQMNISPHSEGVFFIKGCSKMPSQAEANNCNEIINNNNSIQMFDIFNDPNLCVAECDTNNWLDFLSKNNNIKMSDILNDPNLQAKECNPNNCNEIIDGLRADDSLLSKYNDINSYREYLDKKIDERNTEGAKECYDLLVNKILAGYSDKMTEEQIDTFKGFGETILNLTDGFTTAPKLDFLNNNKEEESDDDSSSKWTDIEDEQNEKDDSSTEWSDIDEQEEIEKEEKQEDENDFENLKHPKDMSFKERCDIFTQFVEAQMKAYDAIKKYSKNRDLDMANAGLDMIDMITVGLVHNFVMNPKYPSPETMEEKIEASAYYIKALDTVMKKYVKY